MKKIIIIEKNEERMNLMCDVFMDLLDIKIERIKRSKDTATIETNTHTVSFFHYREDNDIFYSPHRGLKADIVINNTMNSTVDLLAIMSMTTSSHYRERLL